MRILLSILFSIFYIGTSQDLELNWPLFIKILVLCLGAACLFVSVMGKGLTFRLFLLFVLSYGYWHYMALNRTESFDAPEILTFQEYMERHKGTAIADFYPLKHQQSFYREYVERLKSDQAAAIKFVTEKISPIRTLCANANRYIYQFYTLTGRHVAQKIHLDSWVNRPKTKFQQYTLSWRKISVLRERILGIFSVLFFLGLALVIQGILRKPNSGSTYIIDEREVLNREGLFRLTGAAFVFVLGSLGFCLLEISTVGLPYLYVAVFTPLVFTPAIWFILLRNTR